MSCIEKPLNKAFARAREEAPANRAEKRAVPAENWAAARG
jgi:hypothetical protein